MAKADLSLSIGSVFNDEGFKKVNNALQSTSRQVKTTTKALGQISGELNQIGGAAGKAAGAVSGLFASFQGGPVAVAIAAITTGISLIAKSFNEAKERAKDAADYMRDAFTKGFATAQERVVQMFKSTQREIQDITMNSQIARKAGEFMFRRDALAANRSALEGRIAAGDNDYEKRRIEAKRKYQIGKSSLQWNGQSGAAVLAENEQEEKVAVLERQRDELERELERLRNMPIGGVDAMQGMGDYQRLKERAEAARGEMMAHGRNTIHHMATRTVGVGSTGATMNTQYAVTYRDEFERAVAALRRFETENEEIVKQSGLLDQKIQEQAKMEERLAELEGTLEIETEKLALLSKESEVSMNERIQAEKELAQAYKEEIAAIDKAEADAKKAEEERRKRIEEQKRKEEEAARKKEQDNRIQAQINAKQDEMAKLLDDQKQTAVQQFEAHRKEAKAAKELADAEKKAADIMAQRQNNPNMRFGDWQRANDAANRDAARAGGRRDKNRDNAAGRLAQAAGRLFSNGKLRLGANDSDLKTILDANEYLGGNALTDEQQEGLRKEARRLSDRMAKHPKMFGENSPEARRLKMIQNGLKNVDAVKDAEKKRREFDDAQKKMYEDIDRTRQAVKDIQEAIKSLKDKIAP